MGFFSRFEGKMEDTVEGAADRIFDAPISPVQISKKAEKAMRREKMVGAGKQYAPTLYTVLVNPDDDRRLFGYYPTLAGEIETYLSAKAAANGLVMDGQPLVRFIADSDFRKGKFDVIAEPVAAPIITQLRREEMQRYGMLAQGTYGQAANPAQPQPQPAAQPDPYAAPADPYEISNVLPYVPEEELDRSIDYGEYTFNSEDFQNYKNRAENPAPIQQPAAAAGAAAAAAGAAAQQPAGKPQTQLVGQTNQPAYGARLIDTTNSTTYPLQGRTVLVGRGQDCDISLPDINASRHHALFTQEAHGVWILTDQNSTNGTLVNGMAIKAPETLYEGDRITMGLTNLVFTMA